MSVASHDSARCFLQVGIAWYRYSGGDPEGRAMASCCSGKSPTCADISTCDAVLCGQAFLPPLLPARTEANLVRCGR